MHLACQLSTRTTSTQRSRERFSERGERDRELDRGGGEALVIGREAGALAEAAQEVDRREVQGIERPECRRKGLERSCQYGRGEFEECHASQELANVVAMARRQPATVDPIPAPRGKEPTSRRLHSTCGPDLPPFSAPGSKRFHFRQAARGRNPAPVDTHRTYRKHDR